MDRYQCKQDHYINKDLYYFIDLDGKYYSIKTRDIERWTGDIATGSATIINPPIGLYRH